MVISKISAQRESKAEYRSNTSPADDNFSHQAVTGRIPRPCLGLQLQPSRDSHSLYFGHGKTGSFYFSSLIAACTLALSSGVTSRIPCCLACSMAFFRTSSSVFPRTTCLHPDDGSTLAHSMTLPMVEAPFSSPVGCEMDRESGRKSQSLFPPMPAACQDYGSCRKPANKGMLSC